MLSRDLQTRSDNELLRLAKKNDRQAFEVIFNRHWEPLFTTAYHIFKETDIAKDIVQEVFISLWSKLQFIEITALPSYLHQAVKFRSFRLLRDGKIQNEHMARFENVTSENLVENSIFADELEVLLGEAVNVLPDRCKEIYLMSRVKNMKTKEIASELSITTKTVEGQLTKALKQLKLSLNNFL